MQYELIYLIAMQLITAGAIYGGIRADIKNLHSSNAEAKLSVIKAHERIDNLLHLNKS